MARLGEQRPYAIRNGFDSLSVGLVLVFDLKTESEWGKPGQPTALPDLPDHLGPCMCTPRPHS